MTSMQRFDPFREMRHFNRMMNHPFWGVRRSWPQDGDVDQAATSWPIPVDVRRDEQTLTVIASVPGFSAEDVDVSISPDRILSVKACRQADTTSEGEEYLMRERYSGTFARAIRLPGDLNLDSAEVGLDDGVLTVKVPVAEAAQTRRLQIRGGASADDA